MSEQIPTPRRGQEPPDGYQQPWQQQAPQRIQAADPPSPPKRNAWWTSRVMIAAVAFAVGVGVGIAGMATGRGASAIHASTPSPSAPASSDDTVTSSASATPDEIMVTGSLTLKGSDNFTGASGGTCSGVGGFSDINDGVQIAVYDGSSEQIAFGPLIQSESTGSSCVFQFIITQIPPGETIYNFKIGNRGGPSFHQDDLESGDIQLTLGP